MTVDVLSVIDLAKQLKAHGHFCPEVTPETVERDYQRNLRFLREAELTRRLDIDLPRHHSPIDVGTDVRPRPEQLVILASHQDDALSPEYRKHFFLVRNDPETFEPCLASDARFQVWPYDVLPEQELEVPANRSYGFVSDQMRWLIHRWKDDPLLYAWPFRRSPSAQMSWEFVAGERPTDFRSFRDLIKTRRPGADRFAIPVDARTPDGLELLCALGLSAGESIYDFFVADVRFQYVYHLHHHEYVWISCSDEESHASLVSEFTAEPELFQDISGFEDETDDA